MVLSACRRISTSSRRSAELERARAPGDRALGVLAVHAQAGDVRVGQAELASGLERLQHGHGLLGRAARPRPSDRRGRRAPPRAGASGRPRAADRRAPDGTASASLHRLDRLVAVVGTEGGRGSGPRAARRALAPAGRRRSAARARTGPPPRGGRRPTSARAAAAGREPQHGGRVAGGLGVVREPRGVGSAGRRRGERRQRGAVQRRPAVRRQRLLDRHPRQLVAEGDAVGRRRQHARAEALVEAGELASPASASSSHSSACGWDTATAPSSAAAVALRRAARASTASRTVGGMSRSPPAEHLGEEERVARRAAVELVGVDAVRLGELRDGVGRQPRQLAAGDRRCAVASSPSTTRSGWRSVELVVAVGARRPAPAPSPPCARAAAGRRGSPRRPSAGPRGRATVGAPRASSRSSAAATSCGPPRPRVDAARARRRSSSATSSSGPSGARREQRVARAPQHPRRRRDARRRSARTSAVLPTPASPGDEHQPPARACRGPRRASPRARRAGRERSSRSLACASRVAGAVDTSLLLPPAAIVPAGVRARQAG